MVDFSLYDNIINVSEFDEALQELDILLDTTPTELIGQPDYGMNFHRFLWELTPSTNLLKKYILNKIQMHTAYVHKFKYDVDVESEYSDASQLSYIVHINLYDGYTNVERVYKIK